jgi:hypothetical protein
MGNWRAAPSLSHVGIALLKGPVMPTVPLPDENAQPAQGKLNVARRVSKVKAKGVCML